MGQEGSHAHHLGPEFLHEDHILGQGGRGLARGTDHDAAAGLVADVLQITQTPQPVLKGLLRRVEEGVMVFVRCLVAQQVSVRTGVEHGLIALPAPLAQREGHGAVGPSFFDFPDDGAHSFVGEPAVLTALKDEGPKSGPVALGAAL